MANELQVFTRPDFGTIRTVVKDGDPWFVGTDVAKALGYESPRSAVSKKVDEEDRGVSEMETPSGTQQMTIINESGLYSLILSSKLETAKAFKRWVTSEVLPALRKTGSYSVDRPKTPSLKEVIHTIESTRTIMKAQGSSPQKIAATVKDIYEQFGIHLPDFFVEPEKTTMDDVMDMVDFIYQDRPGKKKPTYEDFVAYQVTVKKLGAGDHA